MEITMERSFLLQPDAAPVAMAAEVPQTAVAEDRVITRLLSCIFNTLVPNQYMKIITMGVTTQAMAIP